MDYVMRRSFLYLAAAVSLMLMLATVLGWIWLGRYERSIAYIRPYSQIQVAAFPDAIIIHRWVVTWPLYPQWELRRGNFLLTTNNDMGEETGKKVWLQIVADGAVRTIERTNRSKAGGPPYHDFEFGIWIPYWWFLVLSVPLPLWVMTVDRRRRVRDSRRRHGQCEECGYDLRASPERCPECGAVATNVSSAAA
jgi:hypothetical protein